MINAACLSSNSQIKPIRARNLHNVHFIYRWRIVILLSLLTRGNISYKIYQTESYITLMMSRKSDVASYLAAVTIIISLGFPIILHRPYRPYLLLRFIRIQFDVTDSARLIITGWLDVIVSQVEDIWNRSLYGEKDIRQFLSPSRTLQINKNVIDILTRGSILTILCCISFVKLLLSSKCRAFSSV